MIILSRQLLGLLQGARQDQLLLLLPVIHATRAQMLHHFPDDLRRPTRLSSTASPGALCLPPRPGCPRAAALQLLHRQGLPRQRLHRQGLHRQGLPRQGLPGDAWVAVTQDGSECPAESPGLREGGGQLGRGERRKAAAVPLPAPCPCSLTFLVMMLP